MPVGQVDCINETLDRQVTGQHFDQPSGLQFAADDESRQQGQTEAAEHGLVGSCIDQERSIMFRDSWLGDHGQMQANRG